MGSVVALLILGALAPVAAGTPADDAEPLVQEGIAHRVAFRDIQALDCFQRAYKIAQTPRIEAQIGAAEQALGRWVAAEAHISAALGAASDAWIAENRITLERAIMVIRSHLGSLEILGEPAGAEVRIDGRDAGRLPLTGPLHLPTGITTIEVHAPGFFAAHRKVSVEAQKLGRETIVLEALAPSEPSASRAGRPSQDAADAGSRETASRREEQVTGSWRRPLAWTLAAGAAAGVAVGVVGLAIRNDKAEQYNHLVDDGNCTSAPTSMCTSLRSSGDHATTAAVIGFTAAGAFAIASAILFLTSPPVPPPTHAGLESCGVNARAPGIFCRLVY